MSFAENENICETAGLTDRANNYIINYVGQDYFDKHYKVNEVYGSYINYTYGLSAEAYSAWCRVEYNLSYIVGEKTYTLTRCGFAVDDAFFSKFGDVDCNPNLFSSPVSVMFKPNPNNYELEISEDFSTNFVSDVKEITITKESAESIAQNTGVEKPYRTYFELKLNGKKSYPYWAVYTEKDLKNTNHKVLSGVLVNAFDGTQEKTWAEPGLIGGKAPTGIIQPTNLEIITPYFLIVAILLVISFILYKLYKKFKK